MSMLTKTAKYIDLFCADVTLTGDFAPIYQLIQDSEFSPAY
jgi:hypothetical protein